MHLVRTAVGGTFILEESIDLKRVQKVGIAREESVESVRSVESNRSHPKGFKAPR